MSPRFTRRTLRTATAATLAASLLSITPALAQDTDTDTTAGGSSSSSGKSGATGSPGLDSFLRSLVVNSSQSSVATSGSSLEALLSSLRLAGSSEFRLSSDLVSVNPGYPKPIDESITTAEVISRVPESDRVERWTIASPTMARNVEVQVMLPTDASTPAPMLYLLDGVEAGRVSEWLGPGEAETFFADENVTLVMPTQAQASMYADWQRDDPTLGRHQWETFITSELAPLLEAEPELNFNGHRGIGGLSMGATGAIHIANQHPELFDAAFGLSGCYSTLDPLGRQNAHLTVTTRGGDLDNLYGPDGSDAWRYHDTVSDPSGLRDQRVYLSAATGAFAADDVANYADGDWFDMSSGAVLERSSLDCTRLLDDALGDAPGLRVDYSETGTHDWHTFNKQLPAAWEHIRPALF